MHVLAHHRIPDERLLAQHSAFWASGGSRRVDEKQRTGRIDVLAAWFLATMREQCLSPASVTTGNPIHNAWQPIV